MAVALGISFRQNTVRVVIVVVINSYTNTAIRISFEWLLDKPL
jgi:hypothetical protein